VDSANQLFSSAETSNLNLNYNSTSNFPISNNTQQFDQPTTFLPPEDVEDFFNNNVESTPNDLENPPEYQLLVQETVAESIDCGFQSYNSNNDISNWQFNNLQFDSSFDFDLKLLGPPVTSQASYTEFEGNKSKSSSSIPEIVPQAPVQVTFDLATNSIDFVTKISTVKSNSLRCKKYREDKKNKEIAAEEELKELKLKNYTLKAQLKDKEEKVRRIKEMVKSFFDPRSPTKLSIDAILFEFL